MKLKLTTNQDDIRAVLLDPDIYPVISGDVVLSKDTIFPTNDVLYIGGYDGKIFGLSCFHEYLDGMKFHPNVLKAYRVKYARDFVKKCLDMVKCTVYIEIPATRKELYNFAVKFGFDSIPNNEDDKLLMRLIK